MEHDLNVRAKIALAVAALECADLARAVLGDVAVRMLPGERIRKARRARLESLRVTDLAVLAELGDGASWEVVAESLALEVEEARRIYLPMWERWQRGPADVGISEFALGGLDDPDLDGTAAYLDSWWSRHAEPWDCLDGPDPVGRLLRD